MIRTLILLNILHSINPYPFHPYTRYVPSRPPHYLYRLPQLFQNYLFNDVSEGVTSQTSEVNAEAGRRTTNGNDLLKQYVYTLILIRLLTENEGTPSGPPPENEPFQRTDTLPDSDSESAMNDQPASESPPSSGQATTTEDDYTKWLPVGACRYQAVIDEQDYFYAKQDCASMGAKLAAPRIIEEATDLSSFSEKVGLTGVAYWVGVEENSNGQDVSSDQEPTYSANEHFPGQECLAIVAHSEAVLRSYMSCTRETPAYVCQVC